MVIDSVYAAWDATTSIFWTSMEFWDFILTAISLFVIFSWIFSIVFILWWGLLLILSWWKDDKIKPAINTIRYAVIGIVVTVLTIFVFPILWRLLGIDVEQYAKPERIIDKIHEMWNKIFWVWSSSYNSNYDNIDEVPADFSNL